MDGGKAGHLSVNSRPGINTNDQIMQCVAYCLHHNMFVGERDREKGKSEILDKKKNVIRPVDGGIYLCLASLLL